MRRWQDRCILRQDDVEVVIVKVFIPKINLSITDRTLLFANLIQLNYLSLVSVKTTCCLTMGSYYKKEEEDEYSDIDERRLINQ